jgi:hypothetical protein
MSLNITRVDRISVRKDNIHVKGSPLTSNNQVLKSEKSEVLDEYKAFIARMHGDSVNVEESENDSDFVLDSDANHTNTIAVRNIEELGEEFMDDRNVAIPSMIAVMDFVGHEIISLFEDEICNMSMDEASEVHKGESLDDILQRFNAQISQVV